MSEGVAEVETADGSDENAKCGDQQNLHDVFSFTSAFAAVRTLPTPDPSGYVDRESSVVVAFPTGARGFPRWGSGGGVVRNYGTMYAMRPLRNFKTNQCCHLIVAADTREAFGGARRSRAESRRPSRIANRAFFLNEEEKTRFVERVWRVATFMKTFKQTATMSYNGRRVHPGTIWESRFRAKTCEPDEKCELMNVAAYIDRNPVHWT